MKASSYEDIYGVLDCGRIITKNQMRFLWFSVFLPLLFPLVTLGVAITVWTGNMSWDSEIIGGLIAANVFGIFVLGLLIYVLVGHILLRKNVTKWLEDSVEVEAFVQRPDLYGRSNVPEQLEISFVLDEKTHYIKSTEKRLKKWRNKKFLNYVNSSIKVLFSPKYNRVLFPYSDDTK